MRHPTILVVLLAVAIVASAGDAPRGEGLDTAKIEEVTRLKGGLNAEEGVFKVTQPRTDVQVSVDGWSMPPFMGLTSWAAFQAGKKARAMVAGDLVLFQDEVNPVMSVLFDAGLTVTALHNHFFFDEPKVYFMHLAGEGSEEALAQGVRLALDKVAEIRAVRAACGCDMGKDMGVNTWAAFAGTPQDAIVDGDFAVLEAELDPVLKTLRKNGVNIVAIHHHMSGEAPRMLFLHYWGRGPAADLARAVKAALDVQAK